MKKLFLFSSIILGSVSFASAQSADINPAAAKPATTATRMQAATPSNVKKIQAETAAANKQAGARQRPATATLKPMQKAVAKKAAPAKKD